MATAVAIEAAVCSSCCSRSQHQPQMDWYHQLLVTRVVHLIQTTAAPLLQVCLYAHLSSQPSLGVSQWPLVLLPLMPRA